ncbi:PadR family transcriptional regulator [Clostridium felsineum]|uniref:PadR family transcriptional regulator n=1 Tax=Clostridium felsineum TaxID=36839 RepID=UPI00214D7177|nr:PadR family transcriptional regulator [Clostridium felsineum]MCR3758273.1 PadR family transcriptional regulator [Clostridium felsineum]
MKVQLYILGLLMRYGPKHGYSIKQIVSDNIAAFAKIKLPTIYYHLDKLSEKAYINSVIQKDGNRPEKTVYSITDLGVNYFNSLLNKILAENYSLEFDFDGVLYFSDFANKNDIIINLNRQKEYIENKLKELIVTKDNTLNNLLPDYRIYCISIFNHHIYHLQTELKWINETLKELS